MASPWMQAARCTLPAAPDRPNFPTTPGAFQTTYTGYNPNALPSPGPDGFVTKLAASGDLIYSTFTGLTNGPVVVDSVGQTYVGEVG